MGWKLPPATERQATIRRCDSSEDSILIILAANAGQSTHFSMLVTFASTPKPAGLDPDRRFAPRGAHPDYGLRQ